MQKAIKEKSIQHLKARLRGEVIVPGDEHYEQARRVWNGRVDKHPAVIVRCADLTDVLITLELARQQDMPIAVRGGGHSLVGHSICDDGVVIDLSHMKKIWIDPAKRIAHVQAGLRLGEFVREAQRWGLATTTGTVSGTGLSGLTLGGGNFGIATAFELQLHAVGTVLAGKVVYPINRAKEILRWYREFTATAPDELTTYAALMSTANGVPVIAINMCYSGPVA